MLIPEFSVLVNITKISIYTITIILAASFITFNIFFSNQMMTSLPLRAIAVKMTFYALWFGAFASGGIELIFENEKVSAWYVNILHHTFP